MARRSSEIFNLSFLDLLSGALGAVIFLFIVTPKGGESPAIKPQVVVSIDTSHRQVFGSLHDSLYQTDIGDTLLIVIKDYQQMPSIEDCPECPPPQDCPELPRVKKRKPPTSRSIAANENRKGEESFGSSGTVKKPTTFVESKPEQPIGEETPTTVFNEKTREYQGDPPAVPCQVSFEINWENKQDNIDLFVCKGRNCVYGGGGKRRNKNVGQWDSGKSKNSIFGSDLRTNQEAVRQFDRIIPGSYEIYAQFKETKSDKTTIKINGLIYTKTDNGKENGKRFFQIISLSKRKRTLLGTVELKENGEFTFIKN